MMQCAFWPLLSQPHGGVRFVKRANWRIHIKDGKSPLKNEAEQPSLVPVLGEHATRLGQN